MKTDPSQRATEIHHGENIRKVRTLLNEKQDQLAKKMGAAWSQTRLSKLERTATIDKKTIHLVAQVLAVSPDIIERSTPESFLLVLEMVRLIAIEKATTLSQNLNRLIRLSPLVDALNDQIHLTELLLKGQQDNQKLLAGILQDDLPTADSHCEMVKVKASPGGP
ncbi:helix-turn-helix domain-containing protein [Dawidia soli]|uniref:Helix-turn-helix domain-containing protein n=1 Tax=Dawidia soli TaxID=2782352 RepID=A0AAP2DE05_9BACT|nr:helix-turn-helix transcriptional regulator [Dawidia soli]MBT1689426.1 helix-turn-helix domain-containing protein [Dawidia soli]